MHEIAQFGLSFIVENRQSNAHAAIIFSHHSTVHIINMHMLLASTVVYFTYKRMRVCDVTTN